MDIYFSTALNPYKNIYGFFYKILKHAFMQLFLVGPKYNCDNCQKVYTNKKCLYIHKRTYCGKSPSLQCPECPYKTYITGNLKRHMWNHRKPVTNQN